MSKIGYVIELTINDGGLDKFKELAAGYAASVKANEPSTTTYQWYLAADGSKCLLHEALDGLGATFFPHFTGFSR